MTKEQAIRAKAKWLSQCLEFGWQKSDLDGLSEVWDRFKDEYGNMRPPSPSPVSGSLLESAQDYADKIVPVMGVKHDRIITTREAIREDVQVAFLAGAGYSKGGEENQDWPPNVWQLGNGAQSHLHGKWCYAYRDSEGLNQHQYPFDTEAEAIEDYRKRFFPSRPSLDIDKVVERYEIDFSGYPGNKCGLSEDEWQLEKIVDKIRELTTLEAIGLVRSLIRAN